MMTKEAPLSSKERAVLSTILLIIAIMIGIDILTDAQEGAGLSHMAVEIVVGIAALTGYGILIGSSLKMKTQLKVTTESLMKAQEDAAHWKSNSSAFVEGLSRAIDDQFEKWHFSPSEKEVALLFLKGLSSKEVANLRGVSDRTVRAQATTIYEKSNLSGRAELSAFFLEDLLTPQSEVLHEQ